MPADFLCSIWKYYDNLKVEKEKSNFITKVFFQHGTAVFNTGHQFSQSARSELGTIGQAVLKRGGINEAESTDPWFCTSLSQSKVKLEKFSDKTYGSDSLFALLLTELVS